MNRDDLDTLDKEALRNWSGRFWCRRNTIAALTREVEMLTARLFRLESDNASLRAENAALGESLKLPPKTPDNSSTPPSQGKKPSGDPAAIGEARAARDASGGASSLHPKLGLGVANWFSLTKR
jgi:hypothetical protein